MKNTAKIVAIVLLFSLSFALFAGCIDPEEEVPHINLQNQFLDFEMPKTVTEGIAWPKGQAFPRFSTPAEHLKTLTTYNMSKDERLTFSAFQGLVNMHKTEILLLEYGDVPPETWPDTLQFVREDYSSLQARYQLVKDYQHRIGGLVLYDTTLSEHYRNVASTVAGVLGYLPVTASIMDSLVAQNIVFDDDNIIDLTQWTEETPLEIYGRLYDDYWQDCSKRLLIVADPSNDLDHCRDMAIAVRAAVVYMDTENNKTESDLYQKFVKNMADNDDSAIILGWGVTERSAIVLASEFGVGMVPANYYISSSVYSATGPVIEVPKVPARAPLQNKVYVVCYLSDGDNIQFCQRAMRKFWDNAATLRGTTPVTWTISPALADLGAGIMNYYYSQATDFECFATGPSGVSYLMPTNTDVGAHRGVYLTDKAYADNYAKLTSQYLQRTGLRVMTMWDDAEPVVRQAFADNCRYLYGATVQQFGSFPLVRSSIENDRLRFQKLDICYNGTLSNFTNHMDNRLFSWKISKNQPLFLSYQFDSWHAGTATIIEFERQMKQKYGDDVEFVRADHFFSLYNESQGLPLNLCNLDSASVSATSATGLAQNVADGTHRTMWQTDDQNPVLTFDLAATYNISRYVLQHAELNYFDKSQNAKSWTVEYSLDGTNWDVMDIYKDNTAACTDIDLATPVATRYVRFVFDNAAGTTLRIADIEIYGNRT